jgi:molybdopterin-guanine dinucleotide biosynthesis protein A
MSDPLLAIFVGGRSSRMGSDKGLLPAPGANATLLESLVDAGGCAGLSVALIGDAAPYASFVPEVPRVDDRPRGAGPLGGLGGALDFAGSTGLSRLIAVACDMPYVTAPVLRLLVEHPSTADVLAPRRGDDAPWEPMLARYEVAGVAAVLDEALRRGQRSFQALFENLAIDALPVTPVVRRALTDWDTPQDVPR